MTTPLCVPVDNSPRGGRHPGRRLGASFIGANQFCHPGGRSSTTSVPPFSIGVTTTTADVPDDSSPRGARHLGTSAEYALTGAGRACCAEDRANCNVSSLTYSIVDSGVGGAGLVGATPVLSGDGAALPRRCRTVGSRAFAESIRDVEARRCRFGRVAAAPCRATVQRAEESLGPNAGPDHTLNEDRGYCAGIGIGMTSTPWRVSPGSGQSPGTSGSGGTTVGGGGENRMSEGPGGYHTRMESVLALQEVSPMARQGPFVSESGDTGGNGGEDGMNEGCKECRTQTITSAPQGACTASGQSPSGERLGRTVGVNGGESVTNGDRGGCRRTIESKLSGNRSRHKVPGRQHTNIQATEDQLRRGLREKYPRECKRRNQPVGTECTLKNKTTHLPPGLKAEGKRELGKHYDAIGDDGRELGTASEAGITRVGPITRSMRRNLMKRL